MKGFLIVFLLLTGNALAADITVTVYTLPAGGIINGSSLSYVSYRYKAPKKWTECFDTAPISIQWISGAMLTAPIRLCPNAGKQQVIYLSRPASAAGAEIDLQYAAQLSRPTAPPLSTGDILLQGMAQGMINAGKEQTTDPKAASQRQLNCTSTNIGGMISTSCN